MAPGPHLDDYETHDERQLIPGVGFSVEPGIYLPGEFGIRSEVNMYWGERGPEVTPRQPQTEVIVASRPLTPAPARHNSPLTKLRSAH